MKKSLLYFCVFVLGFIAHSVAQPVFQNPSFEGTPASGQAPPGWSLCTGSPDIMPGFWGTTQTPSDGNTYLGFHHGESVTATFSGGLGACSQMTFTMDVSIVPLNLPNNQYWVDNNQGVNDGYICIYGGYSSCDNAELLWQSNLITNVLTWETLLITLNPSQNYTYLNIVPCINPQGQYTYFGIDNIVVQNQTPLVDPIPDQSICGTGDVTFDLSGGFSSNATIAWTGPNGFTSSAEDIQMPNATSVNSGQYTATVTENGCSTTMTTNLSVVDNTLVATGDATICPGESAQLNASGGLEYEWTPATGLSDPDIANPVATPTSTTEYVVECLIEGQNLIYNGDFEQGNTGFSTSYVYSPPNPLGGPGHYTVSTYLTNGWWQNCLDHTSGSGNMLLVDGANGNNGVAAGATLWCQTIDITPNTDYAFSTWLTNLNNTGSTSQLQFTINGSQIGAIQNTPLGPCQWNQFYVTWNSGTNTTANICISEASGAQPGNDLALDDITFTPLCAFFDTVTVVVNQPVFSQQNPEICDNEAFTLPGGTSVSTTGIYSDTLVAANGCDSIITTNLTVHSVSLNTITAAICDTGTYTLPNGTMVNTTGIYSDTLQTVNGCDSIISVDLTVVDCTPNNLSCNLLCNTDFEDQQVVNPGAFTLVNQSNVPCWNTTASDQQVEVWGTGFNGVPAYSGNQFIELNANLVSTLYQDFQVLPGSTVDISFAHRGRSGTDVMSVSIGPLGGPYVNLGTFSTGNTAWQYYTVSYTFPAIPQVDYSLRFNSISAAGGSPGVGNFLDNISIIMPQIVVNAAITHPTCPPSTDGAVDLTISGGTSPYDIVWDAPISSTLPNVSGLADGVYSYHVTDLYGCVYDSTVTLTHLFEPDQSTVNAIICQGEEHLLPDGQLQTTAGTYVTLLATVNGCDSTVTTNLTVNPVYASTQTPSICDGDTYTLPSGQNVTVSSIYTDTLQTIFGCDSVITTDLTVNPSPVVTVPVSICTGQSYLAQGALQNVAGTYYDTLATNFGCDSVIVTELTIEPMPVHTIDTLVCLADSVYTAGYWKSIAGTYNDTLQTPLGCDSLVITNLGNHPQPNAAINVSNTCLDDLLFVGDASTISGGTIDAWSWQLGNGNTSTLQQPVGQTYPGSGNYVIDLIVWSDQGCLDSIETTVEIYPLPIALFTFDSVCDGLPVQFTDQSTAAGPYPLTQWAWIFSDQQTSASQNPQVTFAATGLYSASLTVTTSTGCKADTTLGDAQVYPNPEAAIVTPQGHCLYEEVNFLDASTVDNQWGDTITSWLWELETGTTSALQNPSHTYPSQGVRTITLTVETANGCSDDATATVETFDRPEVALSLSKTEGCEPLFVQYSDESDINSPYNVSSWNWNLGHGETSITSGPSFTHNYQGNDGISPDTLDISLSVASGQGCTSLDTATAKILVYPLPNAGFSADPPSASMVNPTIKFLDESTPNVTDHSWTFGDGQVSSLVDPVYTYNDTGLYSIGLAVLTEFGCADEIDDEVLIYPHFSFYVPNSFTPNDNSLNDRFRGYGVGYTDVVMHIYDRWGEEIYYGAGEDQGWDGTYKGAPVEVATYIYYISVIDWEGNDHHFRGKVSVIR